MNKQPIEDSKANAPPIEDRVSILEQELSDMRAIVKSLARKQNWPQYITADELAELLGISPRTVHDWVSQGRVPYHKAGNQTRFLISEIVEWTSRSDSRALHAV